MEKASSHVYVSKKLLDKYAKKKQEKLLGLQTVPENEENQMKDIGDPVN